MVRLDLLASAIAGVPLAVAPTAPGELSWTDGITVHVNATTSPLDQRLAVAVQAALVAAGSLTSEVLAKLGRRAPVTARYLAIEGHRALAAHEDVIPRSVRAVIDRSVAARSTSPSMSLAIARSRAAVAPAPEAFGTIRPRQVQISALAERGDEAVGHVPRTTRQQVLRDLDDDHDDAADDHGFDPFNPVGGGSTLGGLLQRLLGASRSRGMGSPGADAATHRTNREGRAGAGAAVSRGRAEVSGDVGIVGHGPATYPEWNVFQRRYRPDWCTVTEVVASGAGTEPPVEPAAASLRRSLARLGLELERRNRQRQGDDIDIDATVEARVARAAGSATDEATYLDSVRRRRELSVLILLDVSGSARERSGSGGTVHEHQRAAAAALTDALADLGDRVALYGFRSQGRTAVQVVPVKRFADRLDTSARRRLHGLVPGAYTRMGAAIRHGASVLETEGGTTRRLLVVLSDGFAYDHGYEGPYGEADTRRALAEARRRGTACLCLSIGTGVDADALRRVFGTAAHARLGRADQLAATAGPLFRSALRLAEVQRRASRRNERTRARLRIEERTV